MRHVRRVPWRALLLGATAVAAFLVSGTRVTTQTPPAASARPKLFVLLVIDQFRADYVDLYGSQWTTGLRRLLREGALFTHAAYPYAGTVTCAGHATISTGTYPAQHGITGNEWYDREARRSPTCVQDRNVKPVVFAGGAAKQGYSAHTLRAPTFADELQRQMPGGSRVVVVSLKPRSAVTLGGLGDPDTVVLWKEEGGPWLTSTAFTDTPWPDVEEFVRTRAITAAYGQQWTRLLPRPSYRFPDSGVGEAQPTQWDITFPHPIDSPNGKPDDMFASRWDHSPFSDTYLADLALHLLETQQLGRRSTTDFLAISFSALDLVGHEYGPRSHEVQDVIVRLDRTIGRVLDALDARVGRGQYTLALTSDHGVAEIPEQSLSRQEDGGRILSSDLTAAIESTVSKFLGPGPYFARTDGLQLALLPGVVDQLRGVPGALSEVRRALQQVKGVWRVYGPEELEDQTATTDETLRAWRLSHVPGRSGDFVITPRRNWLLRAAAGTTHGSPHDYDRRVPLMLFGAGIRAGHYADMASPADIAPTFATLAGISLPHAKGRSLSEAIRR